MEQESENKRDYGPVSYFKEIFSNPRDIVSIPNILVYLRIAMAVLFLVIYILGVNRNPETGEMSWGIYPDPSNPGVQVDGFLAAVIILSCGFTDFLDGYIARKFDQKTNLGVFLDPFADKLLQLFIIIGLGIRYGLPHAVVASDNTVTSEPGIWVVWLLLGLLVFKETLMFFSNIIVFARKRAHLQGAEWYGKMSTLVLYLTMGIMLFFINFLDKRVFFIEILCWICGFALLFALIMYIPKYIDMYRHPERYKAQKLSEVRKGSVRK